jgi:hypothetical protein
MKRRLALLLVAVSTTWMLGSSPAGAAEGLTAQLNSYEETPATLNSPATGVFLGIVDNDETSIQYQLFYADISSNILFAHIHFGKPGESGGIAAFLCGGGGKPACPANGTLFTGTVAGDDVQAIAAQRLAAGDLAGLLKAIKSGFAYVNVHSANNPTGELRGQLKSAAR